MKSRKAVHEAFEDTVAAWLPNILYGTHEKVPELTASFLSNQNSNETKKAYFGILKAFLAWAENNKCESLAGLTAKDIKRYDEGMMRRKGAGEISKRTRAQVLSCLRSYFSVLVADSILTVNPALAVKGPKEKGSKGAYPALAPEDVVRLLDAIGDKTLQDAQERAVIGLMVFTCSRVSAVTKMKQEHIREALGRMEVMLDGKGDKKHWVPLTREAERYLREFLSRSGDGAEGCDSNPEGYVFRRWSKGRKRLTSRPLDRVMCWRIVKRRAKAVGLIGQKISNHTFRATGLTRIIAASGSLETARRVANHSSVNTTKLYDHNNQAARVEDVDLIDYRGK